MLIGDWGLVTGGWGWEVGLLFCCYRWRHMKNTAWGEGYYSTDFCGATI